MNKHIKLSIIVAVTLSLLVSITSCAKRQETAYIPPYPHPELPSKEIREEILSAYNQDDTFVKSFDQFEYYGEFNGCHVLTVFGNASVIWHITVADYVFSYSCSFSINAYKDGEIKNINEAYDSGWLTEDDIAYLSNYHKYSGLPISQRVIPVNTQPNLKPGELDKETKAQFDYLFKDNCFTSYPDKILHYGNYDGVIVFFYEFGEKTPTEYTTNTGEIISNGKQFAFVIHKNERIYSTLASKLHEYLSDEAISEIVKYHNSRK